jgi:CheY-like chemotaxis protein
MASQGRIYRLTASGRKAWETQNAAVPADYRRILGLIDDEAHFDVIRGFLRRYSDQLIADWLAELEELELLSSQAAAPEQDLDFTGSFRLPELIAEDQKRLSQEAKAAETSLSRKGVYVAADRLKNRPGSDKTAADTVVLIVEDDPDQLALAKLRVGMAGYAVRIADSAGALLDALREESMPDILLLDIMLPDGDGFDILANIRRHPEHALLPIVMLTVKDDPADIRKGLALGADGYVTKPYSKTLLADTIRRVLVQPPPS